MIFLGSQETKENRKLMLGLDAEVFGAEMLYQQTPEVADRINSIMSVYAAALSDDRKTMLAYLSMTVVCDRYYRKLLRGEVKAEEFEPWDQKDTAVLFLRNLVVRDRRATPYIFRTATKELLQLCADYEIYLHRCFTIATHWITRRALALYGFQEVGKYEGKHPIMLASRDESAVLNSFLKRYETPKP